MDHRQVRSEWPLEEEFVHLVEPGQQVVEALGADRQHRGQTDRRIHRVPASHPIPEDEHVRGVDPEPGNFLRVGRDGDEMPGDRSLVTTDSVQ